jgi:hypothetical protein
MKDEDHLSELSRPLSAPLRALCSVPDNTTTVRAVALQLINFLTARNYTEPIA